MKNIISVQGLQDKLRNDQPVFVLDIRPEEQREEWYIAGSHHQDIYESLKEGNLSVLNQINLPENIPVVTVCAEGKTSLIASEALRDKGIEAYSLDGGMKLWNYAWNDAMVRLPDSNTVIIQVQRVAKGCLSYVVGSGNEAIVVDASLDPEVYLSIANTHGWKIRYVTDTYIHADYLSRTRDLANTSGAEHLFIENAGVDYPYTPFRDGERIHFGHTEIEILYTPGHTLESTSFLVNGNALLTGDTLFTDGVGRPDLKANQEEAIRKAGQLYDSCNVF